MIIGTELHLVADALLLARRSLREQFSRLDDVLVRLVRRDDVTRRFMTVPGVGPLVALTFRATVDVPSRFTRSRIVGAHFGLTPRKQQSGEVVRSGRISRWGDEMMGSLLYEAAQLLLTRVKRWSGSTGLTTPRSQEGDHSTGTPDRCYPLSHMDRWN